MLKIGFVYPGYENLGIEFLSANLKKKGFQTKLFLDPILFDESGFIQRPLLAKFFSFEKQIIKSIQDYRPDIICISVISDNYQWACAWSSIIKKKYPVPIVVGGIHPSSVPEHVIHNEHIDYLCVGEGDDAIVELAQAIKTNADTTRIKSIWTLKHGQVFSNEVRPLIDDLDSIPFADKELFYASMPSLNKGYTIITSRGCPQSCSFCCNNVWKDIYSGERKLVRRRSVANVIEELRIAKERYNPRYIAFLDEIFNIDKKWLFNFLEEYKTKIALPFSCFIFPDYMDQDVALWLREAGCSKVQMGVQLIDERKRTEVMYRKSSNKKIERCIALCKEMGMFIVCDIIFGFPQTTKKDLQKIIQFFNKSLPDHIEIFWLRYYPRAAITKWAKDNGFITKEEHQSIEQGMVKGGIVRGNKNVSRYEKKVVLLLYLMPILPFKIRSFIVKKKIYEYFPTWFSFLTLYILKRLVKKPKYDLNTENKD